MIDFPTKQNNVCCAPTQNVATLVRETALIKIPYHTLRWPNWQSPLNLNRLLAARLNACMPAGIEWTFFEKLESCGTAPRFVRAEVVAAKRLRRLCGRKARREDRLKADEDRLVRDARIRRERESQANVAARRRAQEEQSTIGAHREVERSQELARLEEFLALAQPTAQLQTSSGGEQTAWGARALHDGGDAADGQDDKRQGCGRLESMYNFGVLKQRVRNYRVQGHIDHYVDPGQLSRRLCLSLRPARRDNPEVPQESIWHEGRTQPISHESDKETHTQGRRPWDGRAGVGSAREAESLCAVRAEIAAQNARRHALFEHPPGQPLTLAKAACALGGRHPQPAAARAGTTAEGGRGLQGDKVGEEACGSYAWGKGAASQRGWGWRAKMDGPKRDLPRNRRPDSEHGGGETTWHIEV